MKEVCLHAHCEQDKARGKGQKHIPNSRPLPKIDMPQHLNAPDPTAPSGRTDQKTQDPFGFAANNEHSKGEQKHGHSQRTSFSELIPDRGFLFTKKGQANDCQDMMV
jgi:hypothetical protein